MYKKPLYFSKIVLCVVYYLSHGSQWYLYIVPERSMRVRSPYQQKKKIVANIATLATFHAPDYSYKLFIFDPCAFSMLCIAILMITCLQTLLYSGHVKSVPRFRTKTRPPRAGWYYTT